MLTEICCNPHNSSEISELLDGLQTHLLSKCCVHKKNCLFLYIHKNLTWLSVHLVRIGQVFYCPTKLCVGGLWQIGVS